MIGFPHFRLLTVLASSVLGLAMVGACTPYYGGTTYSGYEVGRAAAVDRGVIVSARDVEVRGPNSGVGTVVGAGTGAVAGSYIGHGGRGSVLGAIGGLVVGGIIGSAVEDAATRGYATEFIVQRQDGAQFSVVQTNEERLQVGERVVVIYGDQARLTRDNGQYAPPPQNPPQRQYSPPPYSQGAPPPYAPNTPPPYYPPPVVRG
jgi:outer membrane lipoprotein SlyB